MNLAFYTCFYGSNSNPAFAIPALPSLKYKCYYFTNNNTMIDHLKTTKWIGIYDNKPTHDDLIESCMAGKHVKTSPHEYKELKEYDYLCFLDSKLPKVNETLLEEFVDKYFIKQNYALLLREHYFLKPNVWNEYNNCLIHYRYQLQKNQMLNYINKQIANGLREEIPQHSACGFLIRNMKHPKIDHINNCWYEHIQECGIEDQISFFFVKQLFYENIYSFTENPYN